MRLALSLLLMVCVVGCAEKVAPLTQAKKDSLRALLDRKSGVLIPSGREDDFFAAIAAFAEGRRADEFVRSVEFASKSEATLLFSDAGMHGGGVVSLRKKGSKWTIAEKLYFL